MNIFYKIKYSLILVLMFLLVITALSLIGCITVEPAIRTITYLVAEGGRIEGDAVQNVEYGKDSASVIAIPDEGYEFERWSDWGLDPSRNETAVKQDIEVTAFFKKKEFAVEYIGVNGAMEVNGEYIGASRHYFVKYGEDVGNVKAVVFGSKYVFLEWSDGVKTPERTDTNIKEDLHITAIFGIKITYKVDEDKGGKIVGETLQVVEAGGQTQKLLR